MEEVVFVAKCGAFTVIEYFPGGKSATRKTPSGVVVTEREICVASSTTSTSALATTWFAGSKTIPEIAPVPGV
jgi:hypothetical protein